jgi:RHS repeat-associated protein
VISSTGNTPNVYLFAGEQFDFDLGFYYNRARYLEVNRGRFWTQDEFEGVNEDPQSLHKYLYAHNDPVNKLDPSGQRILAVVALTALILAGAAIYSAGVIAPVRDPIKNAVFVTQAGVDNAEYELYWQFVNLLAAVGGIASSSALGARPFGRLSDPTERVKYAKTLKVLQEACFVAGTLVKVRDGEKSIEQVEVGDEVLTKNLETNQVEFKKVHKIFVRTTKEIVTIEVSNKEALMTTPNHPFYVLRAGEFNGGDKVQYGGWVDAKNIVIGDYLLGSTGEWLQVVSISFIQSNETVYNFEVEDNHNYFVGKQGVLVHNGPCDDVIQLAGKIASKFKPEFFQCVPCRNALVKAFKKEGVKGKVLEVRAKEGHQYIISDYYKGGAESMTQNGYHTVVEVEGYIFDTIHPYGIEKAVWEKSLFAPRGVTIDVVESF